MPTAKSRKPRLALVGSDTLRGREILSTFTAKKFPVASFELFDPGVEEEYSKLSQFRGEARVVHALTPEVLEGLDLVFLAADEETNRRCGRLAGERNFRALDLAETFNDDPRVPLIVAGVNDDVLRRGKPRLIANPHAATIILAHLFSTLGAGLGLAKAVSVVLEPVSAYAEEGIQELAEQSYALLGGASLNKRVFPDQVAFNLLARTIKPERNGFSPLENRVAAEIGRVLAAGTPPLSLAIVLAPVFHTYSIMTHFELSRDVPAAEVEACLKRNDVFRHAGPGESAAISPATVAGKDRIHLGPVKKDPAIAGGYWIWAIADNLTVGSGLNAYGIARALLEAA
jgi:aspartate-semialdehyde dehydrogenase